MKKLLLKIIDFYSGIENGYHGQGHIEIKISFGWFRKKSMSNRKDAKTIQNNL